MIYSRLKKPLERQRGIKTHHGAGCELRLLFEKGFRGSSTRLRMCDLAGYYF